MIKISNNIVEAERLFNQFPEKSIENRIIRQLSSSTEIYEYDSLNELIFEVNLRINIISASRELYKSGLKFKVFTKAFCNTDFWELTKQGGFLLKDNVSAFSAIKDIFKNGRLYGTECSTAIVIVYYGALVNIYPERLFNEMFEKIHLMDWHFIDSDLGVNSYDGIKDFLPGDCRYFKNPDVDSKTPEWQGENAIDLGNGTYYGHGIGIVEADEILYVLNKKRFPDATREAYLMDSVTRPDFKYLSYRYMKHLSSMQAAYYAKMMGTFV